VRGCQALTCKSRLAVANNAKMPAWLPSVQKQNVCSHDSTMHAGSKHSYAIQQLTDHITETCRKAKNVLIAWHCQINDTTAHEVCITAFDLFID